MSAVELLAAALPAREPLESPVDGRCCVLGTIEATIGREHAIKPSFTNLDLLRAPDSDRISVRAWRVLTHSEPAKEGKKRDTFPLMQSSWIVGNWAEPCLRPLTRLDVRDLVLLGVNGRGLWAGYVTTSYKKHGSLRAPVNRNGAQRWLFELDMVDCTDRERVADWWGRLRAMREDGVPRSVLEEPDSMSVALMRKHPAWSEFAAWARGRNRSALYRFLCYLLPSQDELKNAGEQN